MAEPKALESSLKSLSINPTPSKSSSSFKSAQKTQVSESWEDEELEDSGEETDRPLSHQQSADYPSAPPPTPISPSTSFGREPAYVNPYGYSEDVAGSRKERDGKRPDKTDAMAKRMIAGALGVRAPKRTEEQREYDKAIKEKEVKRREKEKEERAKEQAEKERQKAAIWED